ncbi:early nodulin-like protein 1 [Carya illinoinensis]|uniref:early nodulin-like protein 1 n=1 Tax=Carya illinoinensis TaxID=32201 RepID=UPI001C71D8D7|nr:early nodulin-like protein 1 [Carya illinoinensis]
MTEEPPASRGLIGELWLRPSVFKHLRVYSFKLLPYTSGALPQAFRYQKNQYNVFEVNQTGYDNCTTEGAVGNWSSGKDFIPLNDAKRYYFICGNGQCYSGMKVSVLVHPLPPPPSSSITHSNSSSDSAVPVVLQQKGFGVLIVSFAISWLGSGWM